MDRCRQLRVAAAVMAAVLAACGSGSGDAGPTTTVVESYGEGLELPGDGPAGTAAPASTTPPTTAGGGTVGTPAPAAPPTTRSDLARNQSRRDDPSGFRLVLTVDDDGAEVRFELAFTNVTSRPLHYDPNERHLFTLRQGDRVVWRDVDCRQFAPETVLAGPVEVEPGETVTFHGTHPAGRCERLPPGRYRATGGLRPCPPSGRTPEGACDPQRTARIESAPVEFALA